jgi:hypothetical protein
MGEASRCGPAAPGPYTCFAPRGHLTLQRHCCEAKPGGPEFGSARPFGPVEGYALLPGRGILRTVDSRYSRTQTQRTPHIPAIRLSQMPGERDAPALHST